MQAAKIAEAEAAGEEYVDEPEPEPEPEEPPVCCFACYIGSVTLLPGCRG